MGDGVGDVVGGLVGLVVGSPVGADVVGGAVGLGVGEVVGEAVGLGVGLGVQSPRRVKDSKSPPTLPRLQQAVVLVKQSGGDALMVKATQAGSPLQAASQPSGVVACSVDSGQMPSPSTRS